MPSVSTPSRKPIKILEPYIPEGLLLNMEFLVQEHNLLPGALARMVEERINIFLQSKAAFAANHGSQAAKIVFRLLKTQPGDEIITSPFCPSYFDLVFQELALQPVFCEVQPQTGNLQPHSIEALLSPKTKAILAPHFLGYPCDLDLLVELSNQVQIPLVEDASQALGAKFKETAVGTLGRYSIFSFGPMSFLPCGTGGLITSQQENDSQEFLSFYSSKEWFGSTIEMDNANAAFVLTSLSDFPVLWDQRQTHAEKLYAELSQVSGVHVLQPSSDRTHSFFLFPLHVERRENFKNKLTSCGIEVFEPQVSSSLALVPGVKEFLETFVGLPCHLRLQEEDLAHMIETIRSGW